MNQPKYYTPQNRRYIYPIRPSVVRPSACRHDFQSLHAKVLAQCLLTKFTHLNSELLYPETCSSIWGNFVHLVVLIVFVEGTFTRFAILQPMFCVSVYKHGLTSIPTLISNHIHYTLWGEITYPFLNCNRSTVEVQEWISNLIPQFTGHVITYQWWD